VNTPATSPLFEKNPLVAALEAGTSVGRVDVDAAGRTRVDVDCSAGMEVVGNETIGNAAVEDEEVGAVTVVTRAVVEEAE